MKMDEVRRRAKAAGVKANGGRADIIRRVQTSEGHQPCFGTKTECGQTDCCWREDCLPNG